MTIDKQKIKAVIFDMDGTMVDNVPAHRQTWMEICARHDVEFTEQVFQEKIHGRKNSQIFRNLLGEDLPDELNRQYSDEKEAMYREIYGPILTEVIGLTALLQKLKAAGVKTAVATTAPLANRDQVLDTLDIRGFFDTIIGEEGITHGKPHPEIYLKTAEKLGVEPSECVAFEDTVVGATSAKAAGMLTIGILTSATAEELSMADEWVIDYSKVEIN